MPGSVLLPPEDAALPRAQELLDEGRYPALLSGFIGSRGWDLIQARAVQAQYRPGGAITVRYKVRAKPPRRFPRYLTLCARSMSEPQRLRIRTPVPARTAFGLAEPLDVETDGTLVWAYPYDPALPGLQAAAHGASIRDALGLSGPTAISVTPLRYRPTQRAAFRYTLLGGGSVRDTFYAKVVRPDAFQCIFDGYESFRKVGVELAEPTAVGGLEAVATFPAMPGENLRDLFEDGGPLPAPAKLLDLIEEIGRVRWVGDTEPMRDDRQAKSAGRLLAHLLPHRRHEIREVYRAVAELCRRQAPRRAVHGDFYEGQLFVGSRFRLGLIDLEDGGIGDPLIDATNLMAHMQVLSHYSAESQGRPLAYRELYRQELLQRLGGGEAEVDWREAYGLLLLATGPFRVQSVNWLAETEVRLDSVMRLLRPLAVAA